MEHFKHTGTPCVHWRTFAAHRTAPVSDARMVTTQVYTGSDAQKGCGVTDLAVAAGVTHASWVQDGGV